MICCTPPLFIFEIQFASVWGYLNTQVVGLVLINTSTTQIEKNQKIQGTFLSSKHWQKNALFLNYKWSLAQILASINSALSRFYFNKLLIDRTSNLKKKSSNGNQINRFPIDFECGIVGRDKKTSIFFATLNG